MRKLKIPHRGIYLIYIIIMKKTLLITSLLSLTLTFFSCGSAKQDYGYEMTCMGVGAEGSNLLKVYSYGSTFDKSVQQAKHDAVHGILFKGIVGGNGCANQPAMVNPEEQATHKDFFDNFFKNGEYKRFVNISNDGSVNGADRLKVGSMYKVGVVISVQKSALRKYLESNGVIKPLGAGIF